MQYDKGEESKQTLDTDNTRPNLLKGQYGIDDISMNMKM